jgi:hypothetical protein
MKCTNGIGSLSKSQQIDFVRSGQLRDPVANLLSNLLPLLAKAVAPGG